MYGIPKASVQVELGAWLAILLFALAVVGMAVLSIHSSKKKNRRTKETDDLSDFPDDGDDGILTEEPTIEATRVTVLKKRVSTDRSGMRVSTFLVSFYLSFLTEKGEELTFEVSQELFDAVNENDRGTLGTANGHFFDFCRDEDPSEETPTE